METIIEQAYAPRTWTIESDDPRCMCNIHRDGVQCANEADGCLTDGDGDRYWLCLTCLNAECDF